MEVQLETNFGRTPLLPALPPRVPKAASAYPNSLLTAPYTALVGVVVDGRQPPRIKVTARDRVRHQVGSTNRWRLPESLGSDLLGTAQAIKSVPYGIRGPLHRTVDREPLLTASLDTPLSPHPPRDLKSPQTARPVTEPGFVPRPEGRLSLGQESFPKPPNTAPAKICSVTNFHIPKSIQPRVRLPKPIDVFNYHSKQSRTTAGPDVLLRCLDMNWELHRPYIQKARVLAEMLANAPQPSPKQYYKGNTETELLDAYVKSGGVYDNNAGGANIEDAEVVDQPGGGIEHPKHVGTSRTNSMTVLQLHLIDKRITKRALAITLGHLYHDQVEVDVSDVAGVLAAAHALHFSSLVEACSRVMISSISVQTVCDYYEAADAYELEHIRAACEAWLQVNLVPQMSSHIQLRQISQALFMKLLQSNRLFTYNEYALYKTTATWVFLQLNPDIQLMPSFNNVVAYFNSLPKGTSLLERESTQHLAPVLQKLRLHGVTDCTHVHELQQINLLPQSWLVGILNQHFRSLQGGGDMHTPGGFLSASVRQGFILDNEPHYHSEILALHGFHFELRAARQKGTRDYCFYMQRLKPSDPTLSSRQSELHSFCMRPHRETLYNIRVQYFRDGQVVTESTGTVSQKFGLGDKSSRSQILVLSGLVKPIYVTFSILFPPS